MARPFCEGRYRAQRSAAGAENGVPARPQQNDRLLTTISGPVAAGRPDLTGHQAADSGVPSVPATGASAATEAALSIVDHGFSIVRYAAEQA